MSDLVVLDTCACFTPLEEENGADFVEARLVDAREGRIAILDIVVERDMIAL